MKTLTIEHIAPYLPYGLKFHGHDGTTELCAVMLNRGLQVKTCDMHNNAEMISLVKNKPVLIPLDKLTDAQYAEVGAFIIGEGYADFTRCKAGRFFCKNNGHGYSIDIQDVIEITSCLYSIKADIHGLIPAGLAISAMDLPENPYL